MALTDSDKERFLRTLRREPTDRTPNWEVIVMKRSVDAVLRNGFRDVPGIDWANLPAVESAAGDTFHIPPAELLEVCRRTAMDAAAVYFRWFPSEQVELSEEQRQAQAMSQEGVVKDASDLERLTPPPIEDVVAKWNEYKAVFAGTEVALGFFVTSVFVPTYDTMGMTPFMEKMYSDRDLVLRLMDMFKDYSRGVVDALIDDPACDFMYMGDDVAMNSGPMVRPAFLEEEWLPRAKHITAPAVARGKPLIYHCCGKVDRVISWALEFGATAMHPIQPGPNDIGALKRLYGDRLTFIGNLDIAGVLSYGTPDAVRAETKRRIGEVDFDKRGYIVCSSHSILDTVPPDNYRAMIETAWEHGRH